MSDRAIRESVFKEIGNPDTARRQLVASALSAMNMRGLLLAARDSGVKEAREILMAQDRPKQATP
jgi:hypothetical protein